jgi:hypothetical protein
MKTIIQACGGVMSQFHDATQQLNFIRQCLVQDKIPIGLFLSAGCPLSIRNIFGRYVFWFYYKMKCTMD